jgi:transposase
MAYREVYPHSEFRKLIDLLNKEREEKPENRIYQYKKPKKINWKAYHNSQINNIVESIKFIREEVERCNDPPRKVGKPIDAKLYTKLVLACELFGLTERNAQGFLILFGQHLGILEEIDDRVIGNAYEKIEVAFILKQIFERNKDSNGDLMGDGTALETSRKQNYGKEKLTLQAFEFSNDDELTAMKGLIEQVEGEKLRLDSGFNCRELVERIAELGMLPYVYPKKINNINGSDPWKEMYLEFCTDIIMWLQEYFQRCHCESFHSSIKRVFGIIRKRRNHSKFVQVMARLILHNRARLSYFKKIR